MEPPLLMLSMCVDDEGIHSLAIIESICQPGCFERVGVVLFKVHDFDRLERTKGNPHYGFFPNHQKELDEDVIAWEPLESVLRDVSR